MKKDSAETAAVAGLMQHLALSHPDVSFRFLKDGVEGLHTPGDGKLESAVYAALGRDFARNENGDWVCTGGYTGGEMVTLPTPVEEATVEQLVDYFFHTSGFAHDYSILNELSDRSTQELATLNDILPG